MSTRDFQTRLNQAWDGLADAELLAKAGPENAAWQHNLSLS